MTAETAEIRVLHVDDESEFLDVSATFLERDNDQFVVETTTDPETALDQVASGTVDCLVSDYDMPGTNGIELLEAVRERTEDLPFILYTGKGSEEIASEAISAGATDYLQKETGTDQYKILANRIRNAVEQYRARQHAAELDRIRRLRRDISEALLRAETRTEAEEQICEIISDSAPYLFAWIGEQEAGTGRVCARASSGIEDGYLDKITITADRSPTGQGPAGRAIRQRRIAYSQNLQTDPEFEPWREEAIERGYRSVAAVPLSYEQQLFGILVVYADRPRAFDEEERSLLVEVGRDISHALHTFEVQTELAEEREFIEQALDSLTETFFVLDTDGRVEEWNARMPEVTGYSESEIAEMHALDFFPPDERERIAATIDEALATGSVVVEADVLTATGERLPYEFTASRLTDADGNLLGLIGTGRDTTRRDIGATELEEVVESIVSNVPIIVFAFDDEGVFTHSEGLALEQIGLEPGEAVGQSIFEMYADQPAVLDCARRALDGEQVVTTFEFGDVTVESWFQPIHRDGEVVEVVGHSYDVSERVRQRRELERQNERLEEFVSVVSHDLQSPLSVAEGQLALAVEECNSDHLDRVARAHDRMNALIGDLLSLAREGDAVGEMETVALDDAVTRCFENVTAREATLRVETDQEVRADPGRLKQLLENLLSNAVEHGGADVTVTVGDLDDGFYVEDDGPGIPPDRRDEVFEAGYSTGEDGTGFGLRIVRQVVDAHGWSVDVTDGRDGGARFEITGL